MIAYSASRMGQTWCVRRTGARRATTINLSREEAWAEARRRARAAQGKAYLHDRNGRVEASQDYRTESR